MSDTATTELLRDRTRLALEIARRCGAEQCEVETTRSGGLNVRVRMGKLETLEHLGEQSLSVTTYLKGAKGSATTSDFSTEAIRATVEKALTIARYTNPDPCAGLPDAAELAREFPPLDLHHPWAIGVEQAQALALEAEEAAFAVDPRIFNSEGATVSVSEHAVCLGNSLGFLADYAGTHHSLDCAVLAREGDSMERDEWYTAERSPADLEPAAQVGRRAGEQAVARLHARRVPTQMAPVLLAPWIASGFIGHAMSALSGGALYRRTSFLLDSIGRPIFAPLFTIREDPFIPRAQASAPFDAEGVAGRQRLIVEGGVVQGYFLSVYSARKLGLRTTGNAGGHYNLIVEPTTDLDLQGLAREMKRGLIVTEVMGQGVNLVTGDYSRGAAGFWVEGGQIAHPVSEITISGNLLELYRRIVAVGSDIDRRGSRHVGSIWIEAMQIAGD
ncbi:MAG: metalloprotease PmbA [Casimicrobiaceae bacterium]|nr:metalloprotease PmbA [Casimicrobiaceae bacterium]MCX8099359.1 metalloprotease PmbA [Casimicrobiaceae bacterium]MDW8311981.1 metalloprotease PmbA [Burkholderiales bacterium]